MILQPTSAEEIAAIFRSQKEPIHLTGGLREAEHITTLSFSKLDRILAYEPEEMIVRVEAGISLSVLARTLRDCRQWIPSLVAEELSETTLGAAIATDSWNPRALSTGMLRTAILGGTFCTTDGTIFKSGSRVVKSVAGYDIHRAFCGSQGLFGAIVNVTLKVQPLPDRVVRLSLGVSHKNIIEQCRPTALFGSNGILIAELAGFEEDIAEDIASLSRRNIPYSELSDNQWIAAIQEARSLEEHRPLDATSEHEHLQKLRRVFDPKQILR